MYILAVDPGVQTGIALLNGEGDIVWTQVSEAPFREVRAALKQYVRQDNAELAAEAAPATRHYQDVHAQVSALFAGLTVHWIKPSEWKNHPFCKVPVSDFDTKHEAEAVGIGRAYLLKRRRNDPSPVGPGTDREHQAAP